MAAYQQVLDEVLAVHVCEEETAWSKSRNIGALYDVDNDGIEELFLHFHDILEDCPPFTDPNYIHFQVWTFKDSQAKLVVDQELYHLAGGGGAGGASLTKIKEVPYLCIWYQSAHSGDAEYIWYQEEYQLISCDDLKEADNYYFDFAKEHDKNMEDSDPGVYHGQNFDYCFLHNDEQLTEEEFLTIRQELRSGMEHIAGIFPGDDNEVFRNLITTGYPIDTLLD